MAARSRTRRSPDTTRPAKAAPTARDPLPRRVADTLAWLKANGTAKQRESMARFAITADKACGVSVTQLRGLQKRLGRDQELAEALWKTGWYEARMLAPMIGEPELTSPATMEAWCRDFDSWAVCDSACFTLFDRSPHAWKKVDAWAKRTGEFQKRAAFALLASLALHDKQAPDALFEARLALIERAATDERNFVKKGVSWALRAIGRRNAALHGPSVTLARRLAASKDPTARWIGSDATRDLTGAVVTKRLKRLARESGS